MSRAGTEYAQCLTRTVLHSLTTTDSSTYSSSFSTLSSRMAASPSASATFAGPPVHVFDEALPGIDALEVTMTAQQQTRASHCQACPTESLLWSPRGGFVVVVVVDVDGFGSSTLRSFAHETATETAVPGWTLPHPPRCRLARTGIQAVPRRVRRCRSAIGPVTSRRIRSIALFDDTALVSSRTFAAAVVRCRRWSTASSTAS